MATLKELQLSNPIGTKFRRSSWIYYPNSYWEFDGMEWRDSAGIIITYVKMQGPFDDWEVYHEPIKREHWINIYGGARYYDTKEEADKHALPDRIACIKIEFTEGEGL